MDAPGKDGNASMPEQVKRPNPLRKIMMMIITGVGSGGGGGSSNSSSSSSNSGGGGSINISSSILLSVYAHTENRTPPCGKTQKPV